MAEVVATMAIRPLVSILMNKSSNYLLDKYKVMEGMEEQHETLQRKLLAILDVITDAEEQAMARREGAKAWLQELKKVAYKANNVFDEFKYEALRREAKKNGHHRELGLDAVKLFPTHNRVVFRYRMGNKLCKILKAIEALIAEMQAFGFKYQPQPPVSKQWRQTDYVIVDPQEIASRSREKDKRNIVDTLLRQASNADLAVVPIVGMGGLGKTTLAQLIYNEPEIQKHFQLVLWVCVSDNFDVNSLAKCIVDASPKKNDDTNKPPLDRLRKLVSGQKYLLVLDDVWNREVQKWERLKVCLQHGGSGSAVLTTTRDKKVAEIMGADKVYNLNVLEDSFIKEIIEARAFSSKKEKPTELVKMVGEIVKRCSGSPLAATALGSVLRTKTSVDEWKAISSRSSICTEETGIMPILKLSYNDLPSHMKQCFAFCALFPKDYKIDVEKLIQLWIANGFIPEHKEDSVESIGKHIFSELASRSFFLDIERSEDYMGDYSRTTCKIHDLMHDIAMSVMDKECVVATEKPSQTEWLPVSARHLFISCEETEDILNDSIEKIYPAIHTLLCDSSVWSPLQHLSKYSSLHALKLCTEAESFPLKPKYLHQLRYLDLSKSGIMALSEDISILYNLQTLDLSNCYYLDRLPKKMKHMISLRHLYTHGCEKLKGMPPELGKLTKLRTLTHFVAAVTAPDCSDVAELEHLNLGGQLELCQVENVIEAESKVANLGSKKDLRELTLRWTSVCDSEVLSNFKPHDGLQVLNIYSYGGKCVGILKNMVEIRLSQCERLQFLFRCGTSFTLPNLKELTLEHLLDFHSWSELNEEQITFPLLEKLFIRHCRKLIELPKAPLLPEPCSGGMLVPSAFPALKVLQMIDLESFQRWDPTVEGVETLFPRLEELLIQNCPKLIELPNAPLLQEPHIGDGYRLVRSAFPTLKVLQMNDLESFQRWDGAVEGQETLFPRLEKLLIQNCPKLIELPNAPLLQEPHIGGRYRLVRSAFPTLKVLKMKDLECFQRWDGAVEGQEMLFPLLEELLVAKCPKLIALPEAPLLHEPFIGGYRLVHPPFPLLQKFFSRYCRKVVALPEAPLLQEPCIGSHRSAFPSLKKLTLKNLVSLQRWDAAVEAETILFPQLETLLVKKCPKLIDLPEAPKLGVLTRTEDGKHDVLDLVTKYFPSVTKLMLELENIEITLEAGHTLTETTDSKFNQKSPTVTQLRCCNIFFGSGGLEPWDYFVHLKDLEIDRCDVLVHWPEKVFQGLVSLKRIDITNCKNLTGNAQAPPEPLASGRNQHLPGLEVLSLRHCESLVEMFSVPASLKSMTISGCQKLESIFGKQQQRTSEFVQGSSSSDAIAPTAIPELSSSPMNQCCPCLEYLDLSECDGLSAVLNLPSSLKTIFIAYCSSIQVLSCQLDGLHKPQVTASINAPEPSAAAAAREHSLPPYLQSLQIWSCVGMLGGILRLPTSLKTLCIYENSGFTSLEPLSGEPPSLDDLSLTGCTTLASLPNEPKAYGSLQELQINDCPAIKKLPRCLQQQLGSIKEKYLDAHYEVMASKPKTWKEIPRMVRERRAYKRMHAELMAEDN